MVQFKKFMFLWQFPSVKVLSDNSAYNILSNVCLLIPQLVPSMCEIISRDPGTNIIDFPYREKTFLTMKCPFKRKGAGTGGAVPFTDHRQLQGNPSNAPFTLIEERTRDIPGLGVF